MTVKVYNPVKEAFETLTVKKVDTGSLPYRLSFEKFLRANNINRNSLSFRGIDELQKSFDKLYNYIIIRL